MISENGSVIIVIGAVVIWAELMRTAVRRCGSRRSASGVLTGVPPRRAPEGARRIHGLEEEVEGEDENEVGGGSKPQDGVAQARRGRRTVMKLSVASRRAHRRSECPEHAELEEVEEDRDAALSDVEEDLSGVVRDGAEVRR